MADRTNTDVTPLRNMSITLTLNIDTYFRLKLRVTRENRFGVVLRMRIVKLGFTGV